MDAHVKLPPVALSYLLPTGTADKDRLDALGALFNPASLSHLKSVSFPKDGVILDIGCGNGTLTLAIAEEYPNCTVIGADVSPDQIEVARKAGVARGLKNVVWEITDIFNMKTLKEKYPSLFDVVHCRFVLSHVPHPENGAQEMLSMTKPGGVILVEEIGKEFHFDYGAAPIKALQAWEKMVEIKHELQKSSPDTAERIWSRLNASEHCTSMVFDVKVDSALKKSMFRMGAEHGVRLFRELGRSDFYAATGYRDGEEWLGEFRALEEAESRSFEACNFVWIRAKKGGV